MAALIFLEIVGALLFIPNAVEVMEGYNASICIQTYEETERDVAVTFSFELLSTFSSMFTLNNVTIRIRFLL